MNARRVVFISQRFWPLAGDAEQAMRLLATALAERGHQVTVLAGRTSPSWPPEVDYNGVRIVRLPRPTESGWAAWRYASRVRRWLIERKAEIDAIVVSRLRHEAHAVMRAARQLAVPVVLRCEGVGEYGDVHWQQQALSGKWIGRACRRAPAIVVSDEIARSELLAANYPARSMHWIAPGVPSAPARSPAARITARESLGTAHAALNLASDTPLVVFAGPLDPDRHLDHLVACWPTVLASCPQARLWLAGAGPDRARLEGMISHLGLRGHVLLPGTFDSLGELFSAADLLVLPRHQAASLTLVEAMAHGLPSVVSDLPANRNVFSANVHGLVTPTGDAVALSSAIVRLLRDAALAQRLGQAARKHACRSFPLDKMVNQHEQLLDRTP